MPAEARLSRIAFRRAAVVRTRPFPPAQLLLRIPRSPIASVVQVMEARAVERLARDRSIPPARGTKRRSPLLTPVARLHVSRLIRTQPAAVAELPAILSVRPI